MSRLRKTLVTSWVWGQRHVSLRIGATVSAVAVIIAVVAVTVAGGPLGASAAPGAVLNSPPSRAGVAGGGGSPGDGRKADSPFCSGLGRRYQASSAAWAFCKGPLPHGPSTRPAHTPPAGKAVPGAPGNADAASTTEDVSPGGLRSYGQSETSIAASGNYVVEAWNDATGLFSACPSRKAQLTGLGFSRDGGKTFTDLEGLPDANCVESPSDPAKGEIYQGDPSVAAYRAGGQTYFYVSSLLDNYFRRGRSFVALAVCQVTGSGRRAGLHCGQPVIAGASSQCQGQSCSFLDKDYLAIDPARGRLYDAFTEFSLNNDTSIEVSACDLGTPAGRAGPAGGTPAAPVCEHGSGLHKVGNMLVGKPYLTIQPADPAGCEYEGAYPAADTASGKLYVGSEHNWGTSLPDEGPPGCVGKRVQDILTQVPQNCLTLRAVSPCSGPAARVSVPVTSISGANLPGYVPASQANDFPRLAVSDRSGTVSMVWNDTRFHPYGDILLQSFTLASLHPVQHTPVVLDTPHHGGLTFMPALRTATAGGLLDVTWYSRNSVTTSRTTVQAAMGVSPRAAVTPTSNVTITSVASNWRNQSFDIAPNFGDYTDNSLAATGSKPYVGRTLYVAWADGRTGVPQPFAARLPAGK